MKKQVFLIISLIASFYSWSIEKEPVKSQITDVTVYLQGAQVFRKANFNVKPGVTDIIIDGICPTIDPKSLQVKASGNLVIIDSKYSLFYPKPEEVKTIDGIPLKVKKEIHVLQDSIANLSYELQELQDEIDVLNAQKNIISNNGAIRGQGKVNDSIQLLKQAIEYYNIKMNEINKKLLSLNRKKADKNTKKSEMNVRLNNLLNYQSTVAPNLIDKGPIHRLTITVSSKEIVSGKLNFSYLVSSAGWTPLYDLKSEIMTGKVNLTYKAQVYQNTGINWDDIRLSVSTNNPYLNKTKPTLHPWYLNYYNQVTNMSSGNGYYNAAPSLKEESVQESYNKKDLDTRFEAQTSADFAQMVEHMISAEFKIDLPYTILSNNEAHMVLIKNQDLGATFKYFSVPKIDPSVYLVAQISKLDDLQLVPAKANIFFDGTYMGETYIDPTTMDDTLSLSLGKDPNIIIKRTLLKRECKEKIIGNQAEKTKSFEIDVKNLKGTNVEIIIQDQVPITQNADISIELLSKGKANHNETTGLLEWKFNLKSKDNEKLNFSYKVKYNKDMNLVF
jgi:uncharacterized protein (TIGR02231 family)